MKHDQNETAYESGHTYFFDLPLSDIYGTGCSALNLIYYGNEHGAFSTPHKAPIDLKQESAIQITLSHRGSISLSDQFDYSLVYYKNDIAEHLWNDVFRSHHRVLRHLTRRIHLNDKPELTPHRLRHFYLKSGHPIYIAKYGHFVPCENCVPLSYRGEFRKTYEGFLMRMPKGFGLRVSLFKLQHLVLDEFRDVKVPQSTAPHVMTYVREGEYKPHIGSVQVCNGKICECFR